MGIYAPALPVVGPACVPWRYGLLSVATITDEQDPHARNGIIYKPRTCIAGVNDWDDVCPPAVPATKVPTDVPGQNTVVNGVPFNLYAYLSCKTTTLEAMFAEARDAFDIAEPAAIEAQVWARVLAQPTCTILNTTLGAPGALSVTAAVAALESHTAANYGCRATFHSDRATVPYAAAERQLVVGGSSLSTVLGSAWAAYAGSPNTGPDGVVAPAGHAWIYATSQLTLRRFPVDMVPESVDQMLRYNPMTNEPTAIAERSYVASAECICAAVLVCLGCS